MVKRSFTTALLVLAPLLHLTAGCAGGVQRVELSNDVAITITPSQDTLPFDPRGARLRSATDQLTRLAGHPVAFQFDATLVNALRADFERQLIVAVEQVARGLARWRELEPGAFARTATLLRRVECRYRATVTEPSASLDAATGVMRIDLGAHPEVLVPSGALLDALFDEDDLFREQVFGDETPDTVKPGDRRAYFDYLTRQHGAYGTLLERSPERREKARVDRTLAVLRLHDLAKGTDRELAARARAWLFDRLPLDPRSRRASDEAYVRWLVAELPGATPAERLKTARSVFAGSARDLYAGIDRFAFGLEIVDQWRRAGRPDPAESKDPTLVLFDEVVCPAVRVGRGELTRNRGCRSTADGWLELVVSEPAGQARLARALDERDDAALAGIVFFGLRHLPPRRAGREAKPDPYLAVLHQLDPRRATWTEAIDLLATDKDRPIEQEGAYLWKTYPERRGDALFLIAQSKRSWPSYDREDFWRRFPRSYGAPIDAVTLRAMLAHGPRALELVPNLWPALAPGFSRVDALLASLDENLPDAAGSLSSIIDRLCADGAAAELSKLHAYLVRRPPAASLTIPTRDAAPGGCRARQKG